MTKPSFKDQLGKLLKNSKLCGTCDKYHLESNLIGSAEKITSLVHKMVVGCGPGKAQEKKGKELQEYWVGYNEALDQYQQAIEKELGV